MRELGTNQIDVIVLNDAPLSRNLKATTTREGQALSRYCDFVPQLAKIEAAHRRRTDSGAFGR
jgi:hypothetical protein